MSQFPNLESGGHNNGVFPDVINSYEVIQDSVRPKFNVMDALIRRERDTLDIIYWSDAVTSQELLEGTRVWKRQEDSSSNLEKEYGLVDALLFHVQPPAP